MLCNYGCEQQAKWLLGNGKQCCSKSSNSCPVNKLKNSEGAKRSYLNGKKKIGFSNEARFKSHESHREKLKQKPFEFWGVRLRKQEILKEQNYQCKICLITHWLDKPILFELDHINGDHNNNKRENLRCICPNCHSQTDTWRGRNINSGKFKVDDDKLLEALSISKNIRSALIKVGLAPKGGNYKRASKLSALLEKGEVEFRKLGETLTDYADGNTEPSL